MSFIQLAIIALFIVMELIIARSFTTIHWPSMKDSVYFIKMVNIHTHLVKVRDGVRIRPHHLINSGWYVQFRNDSQRKESLN